MATVTDPVCGMEIDSSTAEAQSSYEGEAYFFCSIACRETFEANPSDYVAEPGASPLPEPPAPAK